MKSLGSTEELRPILLGLRKSEVSGTDGGAVKCVDIIRNTGGESAHWGFSDAEERKLGERTGLDTPVVLAVNDEHWVEGTSTSSRP